MTDSVSSAAPPPPPPPPPPSPSPASSSATDASTADASTSSSSDAAGGASLAQGSSAAAQLATPTAGDDLANATTAADTLKGDNATPTTLGAVAGARAADTMASTVRGLDTVTAYRVEGEGNQRVNIGPDGSVDIPEVRTNKGRGPERNLYVNFGDEARAQTFLDQRLQQFPDNTIKTFEVPRSYVEELNRTAVPESQRAANRDLPVIADPTKANNQFGLSGEQINGLRDAAIPGSGNRTAYGSLAPYARAAGQGAAVGGLTDGALSTVNALRDGTITRDEASDILANSARGTAVGATYAVTEHGLVKVADRMAGNAIERAATNTAARLGAAEATAAGTLARTAATRLGGAGAAGAVISAGMSAYENREGLARGDSRAIGNVAGDVVVGGSAALAGAAAGAAIGSVVPVAGTAIGAVVGLGVGFAADYVMRAGGIDKMVGNAVSSGVDAVKGAASKVAGWLGW